MSDRSVDADEGYLLANQQTQAGMRLAALATLFDPSTFRHLRDLGVGAGWRCWEVGAGGRSVPHWRAEQVGPTGLVVATDIDTSLLAGLATDRVHVLRHDVGAQDPAATDLDLVHARLVLTHVPRRHAALTSMVAALHSGGWLLLGADIATAAEIDQHLDNIDTGQLPDLATAPMISAWGRKP